MMKLSKETIDSRTADLASYRYTLKELMERWGVSSRCVVAWKANVGGGYAKRNKKRGPKPKEPAFNEIAAMRRSGAKTPEIAASLGISHHRVKRAFSAMYRSEKKARDTAWRIDAERFDKTPGEFAALWKCNIKTAVIWLDRNGYKNTAGLLTPKEHAKRMADYKRIGRQWTELGKLWDIKPAPARQWVMKHHPNETFSKFIKLTAAELDYIAACALVGESAKSIATRKSWPYRPVLNKHRATLREVREAETDRRLADARSGLYTLAEMAERWGVVVTTVLAWTNRRSGIKIHPRRDMVSDEEAAERHARIAAGATNEELSAEWGRSEGLVKYWRKRKGGHRRITVARIDKMRWDALRLIDATVLSVRECAEKWHCTHQNAREWLIGRRSAWRGYSAPETEQEIAHQFGRAVDALHKEEAAGGAIVEGRVSIDACRRIIWLSADLGIGIQWSGDREFAIIDDWEKLPIIAQGKLLIAKSASGVFATIEKNSVYISFDGVSAAYYHGRASWELTDER
jgi:hypothetical protein